MNTAKVSFGKDILPLFRPIDVQHMKPGGVLLDSYSYMSNSANDHANAKAVYDYLTGAKQPRMPTNGPYWSQAQLDLFSKWMSDGYQT
jgi:hypothetical protein